MPINVKQLRRNLSTPLKNLSNLAYGSALSSFKAKKNRVLNKFDNHQVSKELKSGRDADSFYLAEGNLFSLLGFEHGDNPVDELRQILSENIQIERDPVFSFNGNEVYYKFNVFTPTFSELKELTPTAWDESKSWLNELENGISGLAYYIFYQYFKPKYSRSTSGLQSKNRIRSFNKARKIAYMSEIMGNIKEEFE